MWGGGEAEIEILTFRVPYISQQVAETEALGDDTGIGTNIRLRELRNCVVKILGFDTRAREPQSRPQSAAQPVGSVQVGIWFTQASVHDAIYGELKTKLIS